MNEIPFTAKVKANLLFIHFLNFSVYQTFYPCMNVSRCFIISYKPFCEHQTSVEQDNLPLNRTVESNSNRPALEYKNNIHLKGMLVSSLGLY